MSTSRTQHIVPGTLVLLLAVTVAWLSFTREPADAFLFPRLIASVMLILALWNFIRAVTGLAKVGEGVTVTILARIAPGLLITLVYIFYAAKAFGFYAASTVAFFCLFSIYDSASHKSASVWLKRVAITIAFMAVIYCLFTLLLKVQTPRGMFL